MIEVPVDVNDVINQGQQNELFQLQYKIQQYTEAIQNYENVIKKIEETHKAQINELKTNLNHMEAKYYEKEAENNMLHGALKEKENWNTSKEILDLLGCSTMDQVVSKITELQNENRSLLVTIESNKVFGSSECPKCALYQQEIESIMQNHRSEMQEMQKGYEAQLTSIKTASKQDTMITDFSKLNQEISQLNSENSKLKTKIATLEEANSQISHENMLLKQDKAQLEINNREFNSRLEELNNQLEATGKKDDSIKETFTNLIKKLNYYRAQNGTSSTAICEKLSNIFEELLITDSSKEPNLDELIGVLSTAKQEVPFVPELAGHFRTRAELLYNSYESKLGDIYNRIGGIEDKLQNMNPKFEALVSQITEMNEINEELQERVRDFEENDMAPKVAFYQKQLAELKSRMK